MTEWLRRPGFPACHACPTDSDTPTRAAMTATGFGDVRIVEVTNDYLIEPAMLDDPDHLFYFSPLRKQLDADQRNVVLASIRELQREPRRGPAGPVRRAARHSTPPLTHLLKLP